MPVLSQLQQSIQAGSAVTPQALGGTEVILAETDSLAPSPFFDVLTASIARGTAEDQLRLMPLLLSGFANNSHPAVYRDAIDNLLDSEGLRSTIRPQLVPVLINRVAHRTSASNSLIAAYALEGLFRIALEDAPTRYRVLAIMAELDESEVGLFAEHAAKLVGAAYHQWGQEPLLTTLVHLQASDDAAGEATFELGMATLAKALNSSSFASVLDELRSAREFFATATRIDSDRLEASAYCAVIDVLERFATEGRHDSLDAPLAALERALEDRQESLRIGSVPAWLRPRCDREVEWWRLLRIVREVAENLERPSWLNAARVLDQVLSIYDADRTIAMGRGLPRIFAPRIKAAFVREKGLAAHLDDILADSDWESPYRAIAVALRSSLAELELSAANIELENVKYPLLRGVLQDARAATELPPAFATRLEAALYNVSSQRQRIGNPAVQRIFERLTCGLAECTDYRGEIKADFDELLLQIISFCADRQDADKKTLGPTGTYLRSSTATEGDLQSDLRQWLKGNMRAGEILSEVPGVATGRTDIHVSFGNYRFIIELKKHEGLADAEAAKSYRGQASSYQATNVRIGFLGMLELLERRGPPPTLEECLWNDAYVPVGSSLPRFLVTFRVPGMLKSPHALR